MNRIGIIANPKRARAGGTLEHLCALAQQYDLSLYCAQDEIADRLAAHRVSQDELMQQSEALLALGGDGTVLYAASMLHNRDVPILGINLGQLGFLTGVAADELEQALQALVSGGYQTEKREMLSAQLLQPKASERFYALNDFVLGWGGSSRTDVRLLVDGGSRALCL